MRDDLGTLKEQLGPLYEKTNAPELTDSSKVSGYGMVRGHRHRGDG